MGIFTSKRWSSTVSPPASKAWCWTPGSGALANAGPRWGKSTHFFRRRQRENWTNGGCFPGMYKTRRKSWDELLHLNWWVYWISAINSITPCFREFWNSFPNIGFSSWKIRFSFSNLCWLIWANFITTFPAGFVTPNGRDCKGNVPKMSWSFRFRDYCNLPREIWYFVALGEKFIANLRWSQKGFLTFWVLGF